MNVIIVDPDKAPKFGQINTFEELQALIGGYVQIVNAGQYTLAMDEEGQIKDLEKNLLFPLQPQFLSLSGHNTIVIGKPTSHLLGTVVVLPNDWGDQFDRHAGRNQDELD